MGAGAPPKGGTWIARHYSPEYGRRFQALGPVDKVDSQLTTGVIQDCFWGGSFDSRFDDGHGVGVFRAIRDHDWREERSATGGSPTGAGRRVLDRAHGCSLA